MDMMYNKEVRRDVRPIQVDMLCPECGQDYMITDESGVILTSYPPLFPHYCPSCGCNRTYYECYPRIEYEVI